MKYDIKTILVLVLLATTILFGYNWYFGDNGDKDKIKELDEKYSKLEAEKKEKDLEIAKLHKSFVEKDALDKKHQKEILIARSETAKAIKIANESKRQLNELKTGLTKTKKEIEAFEKNPPNKEGDALLISIKNHTK
jgi:predicted negative regulator of RcsB-dependent stress response